MSDLPIFLSLSSDQQELLKWAAILSMTVDHVVKVFYNALPLGVAVGRLAFPLFALLLAYNLTVRRVEPRRYLAPLLLAGCVAQPAYLSLFPWAHLNIMFTLLLGIAFLPVTRRLQHSSKVPASWALVAVALVTLVLSSFVDYGFAGALLVPTFQTVLERFDPLSVALLALVLLQVNHFTSYAFVGLLAPLLVYGVARCNVPTLPRNRWVFIVYYPLHLAALWLLRA